MSKKAKYILIITLLFVLFAALILAGWYFGRIPSNPPARWGTPRAISTMPACSANPKAWYTFPIPGTAAVSTP